MNRLSVRKTYKLYIGGAFPRTESGRALTQSQPDGGFVAHYSQASRKDLRNAVAAARKAQPSWQARAAFNRGQILYRMAEMMESRRAVFSERLQNDAGLSAADADTAVSRSVDTFVGYAGWADKFPQVFGAINPVAAPFFNFTTPSPIGVVVAVPANDLVSICDAVAATIVSGNTVVLVVEAPVALAAIELAEVFATSDLPGGVVNVLTGLRDELLPHIGTHRDIDAVLAADLSAEEQRELEAAAADVVKRVHVQPAGMSRDGGRLTSPYRILPFVEFQTAWHPIGR